MIADNDLLLTRLGPKIRGQRTEVTVNGQGNGIGFGACDIDPLMGSHPDYSVVCTGTYHRMIGRTTEVRRRLHSLP